MDEMTGVLMVERRVVLMAGKLVAWTVWKKVGLKADSMAGKSEFV